MEVESSDPDPGASPRRRRRSRRRHRGHSGGSQRRRRRGPRRRLLGRILAIAVGPVVCIAAFLVVNAIDNNLHGRGEYKYYEFEGKDFPNHKHSRWICDEHGGEDFDVCKYEHCPTKLVN